MKQSQRQTHARCSEKDSYLNNNADGGVVAGLTRLNVAAYVLPTGSNFAAQMYQGADGTYKIAYRGTKEPQYAAGQRFFVWARNLVQDAFYTSPVGVKDLGFVGNGAMAEFSVPKEAVAYAIKRSPFANEG